MIQIVMSDEFLNHTLKNIHKIDRKNRGIVKKRIFFNIINNIKNNININMDLAEKVMEAL